MRPAESTVLDRGITEVSMELPLETGELLEKALDKVRDDECLEIPDLANTSWSTLAGDEGRIPTYRDHEAPVLR